MHNPFNAPSYFLRLFSRLPYDIQEAITNYLSQSDLHALSLASKYLSSLAARAMYARVLLHSSRPVTKTSLRPADTLRTRQFSFLMALSEHPEYSNFVRHLEYEFMDYSEPHTALDTRVPDNLVWEAFARCKGVTSIHITMSNGHDAKPPKQDLFPNLKHAKISGTFPPMTLDRMLHTSPRLQTLQIAADTSEHVHLPREWPAWSSSLSCFINRSRGVDAFNSLKRLDFAVHLNSNPNITPSLLLAFIEQVIPHLEDLTLSLTTEAPYTDELHIAEVLESNPCQYLSTLHLKGKISLDATKTKKIGDRYPKLRIIMDTHDTVLPAKA